VKARVLVLGAAALTAWGLKRHYAVARPDDLLWILSPTAWLVGVATGATFTFQPGEGYLSRESLFLIEKSCAGINFMIAAFGMSVWALVHRPGSAITAAQVLGVSLLASYTAAVVVNTVRIAAAMWLAAHPAAWSGFGAADVHRFEGILVYFGGLVLLYEIIQRLDRRAELVERPWLRRTALPLASYYAVTLAIPLANGAGAGSSFLKHALVVLVVPPVLVGLAGAIQGLHRAD
jgi:exosortase K